MTLEQLRIFLAVAERQHVTRAAETLHLTQSAVSASVAALERTHGVTLFDRIGRRIVLTDAGEALIPEARAILNRVETAELLLQDMGGEPRGRLRIHASQTVASYWLPQRMVALNDAHPRIELALSVGNTAQVARAVAEGAADLGLVEGEVSQGDLHRQVVARDELVMVVARDHPLATGGTVAPADYPAQRWILREEGSGTRSEFEGHLAAAGLALDALDVALELPSNEAVIAAVSAGGCVSVLSRRAVESASAAGRVRALAIPGAERPFAVLTHPGRHRTQALQAMLALLTGSP
ncbi:LysR family transcriptional regulator [Aquicoccus sp. SCR17]|nr:LysR family transcriptional regulator [Carideicomes alvinocaridis]